METKNEKTVSAVRELAEFVNDGVKGYKRGADETKNLQLRSFCLAHSAERAGFLSELNSILQSSGEKPEKSGTIKGSIYRQWMDVKSAFAGSEDSAIINSCLYGEEWALKAYGDALKNPELPADVRKTLEMQSQACKQAYNELEAMKEHQHSET